MWRKHGVLWSAVLAAGVLGCGKSDGPGNKAVGPSASINRTAPATTSAGEATEDPAAAVAQFLEAVRTGNDERANGMLSASARKKMSQLGPGLTPPASDTARFEVGKVELHHSRRRPGRLHLDRPGRERQAGVPAFAMGSAS